MFTAAMWAVLQGNLNDGIVNQVCTARVYNTGNQAGNNTFQAITFNSVRYDGDGMHSGGSFSQLTCQTAGVYRIGGCAEFAIDGSAPGRISLGLRVNGSILVAWSQGISDASVATHLSVNADWQFSVSDYVELVAASQNTLQVKGTGDVSPELWMSRV